ncbi:uncharacterized protein LOC143038157 [Oratosquilla oratoria]|uniref:uncharacterized protein LOC143038157 n=1 Tax=Oratosquilla oratoria TaxID=337810 RepID=UPI003F76E5D3
MMDVLNVAIKIVNFVKAGALNSRLFKLLFKDMESEHEALLFHTNVRWLSKGNMLGRLYELREEVEIFLDSQQKVDLYDKFQYFPDIDDKCEAWEFIRNPFQCEVADVAKEVQEEFLELKFDSTAKEDFKDMYLETFWVKYLHVYSLTSHKALLILTMFGSTYMSTSRPSSYISRIDAKAFQTTRFNNIASRRAYIMRDSSRGDPARPNHRAKSLQASEGPHTGKGG